MLGGLSRLKSVTLSLGILVKKELFDGLLPFAGSVFSRILKIQAQNVEQQI